MVFALEKLEQLKNELKRKDSIAIAFSGGVDSAFLLKVAYDVLGEKVLAITVDTEAFARGEIEDAKFFCQTYKIKHKSCFVDIMKNQGFVENSFDRCYRCKFQLFDAIKSMAINEGIFCFAEGSNADDENDFRPGHRAINELEFWSPLRQVGLNKDEIRFLSQLLKLPTWEKPSFACLASRFPYGEKITTEGLRMIESAENVLAGIGFRQYRVRIHKKIARIEVYPDDFNALMQSRINIIESYKKIGFDYVTLDLMGFRTGSMNEVL